MYKKASLLSAFISFQNLAIIYFSESYLNYKTLPDHDNIEIYGYSITREDRF